MCLMQSDGPAGLRPRKACPSVWQAAWIISTPVPRYHHWMRARFSGGSRRSLDVVAIPPISLGDLFEPHLVDALACVLKVSDTKSLFETPRSTRAESSLKNSRTVAAL